MIKTIIALAIFGSALAQAQVKGAQCYFSYANKRLDQKIGQAIGGLGIGLLWQSGVARTTEIITESIALTDHNSDFYLREIKDGAFGARLEKIIEQKRVNRLHTITEYLIENGSIPDRSEEENLRAAAISNHRGVRLGSSCEEGLQNPLDLADTLYSLRNKLTDSKKDLATHKGPIEEKVGPLRNWVFFLRFCAPRTENPANDEND